MMSKRARQYIGILFAIVAYYIVHEGAHLIVALVLHAFKKINFMGTGSNIFVFTQWSIWWWRFKRNPLFNATGMGMDNVCIYITF